MNPPTRTRPPSSSVLRASWRQWIDVNAPAVGSPWLQPLWTVAFSACIAVVFTLLGFVSTARTLADWIDPHKWGLWYGRNLIVSLVIGFMIHALFKLADLVLGRRRVRALSGWRRSAFFMAVPLLGTAAGWPLGVALIFGNLHMFTGMTAGNALSLGVVAVLISAAFYTWFSLRHKEIRAEMRANEARLRLLQGQMEPHFLFNTLANVISLIDTDAPRAKSALQSLTDYLRASIGSLRHADSTLGAELELATRYLELMQTRMGERLRFEIDVDASLHAAALAPLLLQPLVENAVKHGLEAQVDGGTVRVRAERVRAHGHDTLRVCVDDDGAGLAAAAARGRRPLGRGADGNGVALANLRERLLAQFGDAASLTLSELEATPGTRACIAVPWRETVVARSPLPR
jgi:signal transduction histidine kinase